MHRACFLAIGFKVLTHDFSNLCLFYFRDHTKFDAIQLGNLKEYLATSEERVALEAYMGKGAESEAKKESLFRDLSETEKYMVTLMQVPDVEAKLHTMEFRNGFKNRFSDITSAVRTLNAACDELRSSEKFRKLMAMILTVVNQINTGGEGNLAMGFTLDALLKLNEVRRKPIMHCSFSKTIYANRAVFLIRTRQKRLTRKLVYCTTL